MAVALVLLALEVPALDPSRPVDQYTRQDWSLEAGLPQSSANALVQAPDGYIYIATFGGLVRFDGVRVTVIPNDGSCSNRLFSLEVEDEGGIWVGTERAGLCRLENGMLRAFAAPDGRALGGVSTIRQSRAGGVWVGSAEGLLRLTAGGFRRYGVEDGLPSQVVVSVDESPDGTLWVGTHRGLCLMKDDRCAPPSWSDALGTQRIEVVRHGRGGETWIGARSGLFRAQAGRVEPVPLGAGFLRVRSILEDRDGNVWVGLEPGGLRRVAPREGERARDAGVVTETVASLLEDREGNLWIGFSGAGVAKLSDGRAIGIRLPDEATSAPVMPIVDAGNGVAWVGTACAGLSRVSPDGVRTLGVEHGLTNPCVWSLLPDPDGGLWIGTHGHGLFRMSPGESFEMLGGPVTSEQVVRALARDEDGRILVGTDGGLFRHDPARGGFEIVAGTEGADVHFVLPSSDGAIWAGTRTGALIVERSGVRRLDRATGLSSSFVRAILRDGDGIVWLGTYGGGLNRIDGDRVTVFDTSNGMPDNVVSLIVEDSTGRFWMTGNRGVMRVERKQLEALASGSSDGIVVELFDSRDGMPSSETNGGGQPAGALFEDGRLWVPTVSGVAIFDTSREIRNALPPPGRIEAVLVDGEPVDLAQRIVLPPRARNLEIRYTALSFRSPDRVRFRYRLDGFDERWIDAGNRRVAYYPVIPSGALAFHVIAGNDDGVWNEAGARFEFEHEARLVESPWFYVMVALLAAVLGASAAWLRSVMVARDRRKLEEQVDERTSELSRLADLIERINHAVTLEEVLDYVYESLRDVIPYDRIGLALLDENRVVLRAVWSRSESKTIGIGRGYEAPIESSSLMKVLETGEPRVIRDLEAYFEEHPDSESTRRILSEGVRSSMTCPLKALGRPVGFLFFSSFTTNTYDESHVRLLRQIAGQLSLVVGKSKLYEDLLETKQRLEEANRQLETLASVDGLTGIANRRSFDSRLVEEWRRAVRSRTPLSLLMIDVDCFKAYNDRHGHATGDDCLRTIATVLAANLRRASDMASRFGGEEFAVILPETDDDAARMMAERLRSGVEGLRMHHGASAASEFVTISVGGATIVPTGDSSAAELIRAADAELYEAKRTGRNRARHR
jgi:diguanylate cyclase (GGDEF)-like protein